MKSGMHTPNKHKTHLQCQLELRLDAIRLAVIEQFSAVAALEYEGVSKSHIFKKLFEFQNLPDS